MLSIQERQSILQRYLDKIGDTYTRKRLTKAQCLDLIEEKTGDVKVLRNLVNMLRSSISTDWILMLYKGGYPIPCYIDRDCNIYNNERKTNLLRRYSAWKYLRPQLETQYHPLAYLMLPHDKYSIYDFHCCVNPRIATLDFFRMVFNYIPIYSIYMYDPTPGTGYKYYSGERLLLYYVTEDTLKDRNKSQKLVSALLQDTANGLSLKSKFKVVISTVNWHALKDWPHYILNDDCDRITFQESLLTTWKNCYTCRDVFKKYNLCSYVLKNSIYPWPYAFKNVSQVYSLIIEQNGASFNL